MITIKETNDNTIIFNIDIYGLQDSDIIEEVLSLEGREFEDFISNIELLFNTYDFELVEKEPSSKPNSKSLYLYYKKVENEKVLKAFIRLRISDHDLPDRTVKGKFYTGTKLAQTYFNDKTKELAKSYNQTRGYKKRMINIVLDGVSYNSYEEVLNHIEDRISTI